VWAVLGRFFQSLLPFPVECFGGGAVVPCGVFWEWGKGELDETRGEEGQHGRVHYAPSSH
jgi:hypothetical protein